jgi:signal transduction histidine kinase
MSKLTSTQVLGCGFAAILTLLGFSAVQAARLQRASGEQQAEAYNLFIKHDNTVTAVRRTIWLGGIYARDYFLNRTPAGRVRFSAQLLDLQAAGGASLATLRAAAPAKIAELDIQAGFEEFIQELRLLDAPVSAGIPPPAIFIEETLIPRRLALLASFEDLRSHFRQELVTARNRYDEDRQIAARRLLFLVAAALCLGVLVAFVTLRYALRLQQERQRHFESISLAKMELELLSARLLEIQEQERRTLSQELHDEVGQTLTALRMEISQTIPLISEPASRERLTRARQLAEKTVQMVRNISLMLRPSLLDDLGLGPAVQWQLEQFSKRSGIQSLFNGADVGETLADAVKTCVFRIAQETLNNCEKYSQAANVVVNLRLSAERVSLEIVDDGVGFTLDHRGLPAHGTGILGMKERAATLGGVLLVDSSPGKGTRVSLVLPIASTPTPRISAFQGVA